MFKMATEQTINVEVNGKAHEIVVEAGETLVELLRDKLALTGTKEACGYGECGSCTVVLNGKAVNSCLVFAWEANGGKIVTVEGLRLDDIGMRLQKSFVENGSIQCGYCTPGMLMSAYGLLLEKPGVTREDVIKALEGNLCRCTGYGHIVKSILEADRTLGENIKKTVVKERREGDA